MLTVRATDPAGNVSADSASFVITVDTASTTPAITSVTDAVAGGVTGAITNDGTGLTNDARPQLTGTADKGSLVTIYNGTTPLGSVYADAISGAWSWQYAAGVRFTDNRHELTVQAVSPAGTVSAPSAPFTLSVDTQADRPVITTVTDAVAGGVTGGLPSDGIDLTNDARPVIAGTAEKGSLVTIYSGATPLGSVYAHADTGAWSWQYGSGATERFTDGEHVLTVRATDPAGNPSAASASFVINVDTFAAASITAGSDNVGALTETILRNRVTDDTTPEFHGTAERDALVILYDNGMLLGSFYADSSGNWSWTLPELLPGKHNLTIASRDKAGNLTMSTEEYPFQIGQVWDFNDGTFNGWTLNGAHANPGASYTKPTADGGFQLEFITPGGPNYAADVMSVQIEVEAGKSYDFSFILSRITSFQLINPAQLALTIDGVPVSNYITVSDTPQKVEGSWTASTTGTVTLAINNRVTTGSGNDFWIDDIAIAPAESSGPLMTFSALADVTEPEVVATPNSGVTSLSYDTKDFHEEPYNELRLLLANAREPSTQDKGETTDMDPLLIISASDVLALNREDLFLDNGIRQLMINGEAGDVVNLPDLLPEGVEAEDWNQTDSVTLAGVNYQVLQHSGLAVELLVQQDVIINLNNH